MTPACSQQDMERRLARYQDLAPCATAFIDARTPGNQKENFTIIGPGVAESPEQHVHIDIPHGFNIGGVRQTPHCVNSQHSHETAEVFIVRNSRWAFRWGVEAEEGEVRLGPGDVISIPTQVFRGFENVGVETGYMCAVLGGDDPGRVTWAPGVFDLAREHGLVLMANGRLVDTAKGEQVPDDIPVMPPTTQAEIESMRKLSQEDMEGCVWRAPASMPVPSILAARNPGVEEAPVIGPANPAEEMAAGKMSWPHGFHLRRLKMVPGSAVDSHSRLEEEVIYIQQGELAVAWRDGDLTLGEGDVLTLPKGLQRRLANPGPGAMIAYVTRGGDSPAAPQWAA